jgi:ribose/xylose/arabinose/galactoside ABC-type transport system permease subunit
VKLRRWVIGIAIGSAVATAEAMCLWVVAERRWPSTTAVYVLADMGMAVLCAFALALVVAAVIGAVRW